MSTIILIVDDMCILAVHVAAAFGVCVVKVILPSRPRVMGENLDM